MGDGFTAKRINSPFGFVRGYLASLFHGCTQQRRTQRVSSLAHYDALIDQSACRIVCMFLGLLVHGDTLAFPTHIACPAVLIRAVMTPTTYDDKHTDACTSCRLFVYNLKCAPICLIVMEHYVFRFSLGFAIGQPYAVSRYAAWSILTHPARISQKFQGLRQFIVSSQARRLYYSDVA